MRQLARQLVRWRPWNRQRNDRVELRQVLPLQPKLTLHVLDLGRDDGTREAHIRRSGPGMQSEVIWIVDLAQRGETETLAVDAKGLPAKSSVAGKAKGSGRVRRGG